MTELAGWSWMGGLVERGWVVRWWRVGFLAMAGVVTRVLGTLLAVAVNVATGGTSPWWPAVQSQPLWWTVGLTVAAAGGWLLAWWAQRLVDREVSKAGRARRRDRRRFARSVAVGVNPR